MVAKVLGRASYSAYRLAGMVNLSAIGETVNINDKFDFEEQPFVAFPPVYAFFRIEPGFPSRTSDEKPVRFNYQEAISYPSDAKFITIHDADGSHSIPIAEVVIPPMDVATAADDGTRTYCVFQWIGINSLMIAKCNAPVAEVYSRVFGPDSYPNCQKYVADNGGISP